MRRVQPEVFLIGESAYNSGMRDYLSHVGAPEWESDTKNDSELLSEFYGRLCYRSFRPKMNPNVTKIREGNDKYLANILKVKHGSVLEHAVSHWVFADVSRVFCYDGETEVLTDTGWKKWCDVNGKELFCTLNPDTDLIEYQRASEHFVGLYEGPMYRVKSEQIDLLVTPNHRMWVQKHDTQAAKRGDEPYRIYTANEIAGKRVHYQKSGTWVGVSPKKVTISPTARKFVRVTTSGSFASERKYDGVEIPAEPFARFLGHWISEGSLNRHQIVIAQKRGVGLEAMAENIRAMELKTYTPRTGHGCVRTQNIALRDFLESECGRSSSKKRVPKMVHDWSPSLIRTFLSGMVDGDGSRRKDCEHEVIYTTSKGLADDLQILAIKAGWSANVRVDDRVGHIRVMKTGQVFEHKNPCYIVSLVKTRVRPLVNHNGYESDGFVPFKGTVYCVKVPNGLLFVRRNGKPVVSGNTHELVRHRAGCAYSQESLRFVRLTDLGLWLPPEADNDPVMKELFEMTFQSLEKLQIKMADHLGLDDESKQFKEKKVLTSMMRRLAPEGLATTIGATFNFRALRHVIEMRTAEGAEAEIRLVFDKVASIAKGRWPNIFSDFSRREDGSWVPGNSKV